MYRCFHVSSALLGLAAALAAQQPVVAPSAEDLRGHYTAALDELRAADTSRLQPEQHAMRLSLIQVLDDYVTRGDFGRDTTSADRDNLFRDDQGRLCAVACLLQASGEDALIERIAAERNEAYIFELADVPGLSEWLASVGLTAEEAARVQGPSGLPPEPSPPPAPVAPPGGFHGARGRAEVPSQGSTAAATGAASATGQGKGGPSDRTGNAGGQSTDPVTGGAPVEDWWLWWEMNKAAFLQPQQLHTPWPSTGNRYFPARSPTSELRAQATAALLPELRELLQADDASLRSAAVVTLGRLGGDGAVPDILPLLDDPVRTVREAAILALGASAGMDGAHALLELAQWGALETSAKQGPVCASARPLALMALGVARRRGLSAGVDSFVADFLDESNEATDVREAALMGLDLAHCPLAAQGAADVLAAADDPFLACRALEVLGASGDPSHLPALLRQVGGRDVEQRRAASLALGGCADPLLAAALKTAFEVEKEPLTRGFLLLALGAQEGASTRDFLERTSLRGPAESRPWAALGLGLMARHSGDRQARATLRARLPDSGESQGAWVLACGLGRDEEAAPDLARLLDESANPRVRLFAALALAMTGAESAADVLAARFDKETSPLARVGLAQGLGVLGRPQDAGLLVAELQGLHAPVFAAQVASALGFHGSPEAVEALLVLVADPKESALARAAGLDALGLLLDDHEPLLMAEAARGRNFRALPTWLGEILPTTTL